MGRGGQGEQKGGRAGGAGQDLAKHESLGCEK